MKKYANLLVILTVLALGLGGCATMSPNQQSGALLGGALGAGIPLLLEESASVVGGGALIGGAVGAVFGEVFGPKTKAPAGTTVSAPPSGLESIEAEAYAKEKQKILLKRQRAAEKAAKAAGIAEARSEMAE